MEAKRLSANDNVVMVKGKDLLSAGAESGRISPDYTYYLSLSNLPERGGKGLEVVEE